LEYNEFKERQQVKLCQNPSVSLTLGGNNNGRNGNRCSRADLPDSSGGMQKSLKESLSGDLVIVKEHIRRQERRFLWPAKQWGSSAGD